MLEFETGRERRISATEYSDHFGIHRVFSGKYWETSAGPLENAALEQVNAYEFPRLDQLTTDLEALEQKARYLHEKTPYVVVAEHPVNGVLELACRLCGYEHIMCLLATDPEFISVLFGKILAFQKEVSGAYYSRLGRYIHMTTSGDDFGTQKGLFMSPAMFREFIKPCMKQRFAHIKEFTDAVQQHHSCGNIFQIIPDLIEAGVEVLNPIQPVAGMEPQRLKSEFGRKLTFHGGLDTQALLPSGNHAKIREGVNKLIRAMHPKTDGGFIFAPAHNFQEDVSASSAIAMYDAALEYFGGHL
jgi:uroporphyrinogen decarboxylase